MEKQPQGSLEILISPESGFSATGGAYAAKANEAFDALGALLTDAIEPFRKRIAEATASADELELRLDLSLKGEDRCLARWNGVRVCQARLEEEALGGPHVSVRSRASDCHRPNEMSK